MKHSFLILVGLGALCSALYFQHTQKFYFNRAIANDHALQKELKALEDDLDFLKKHHKQLSDLIKKGWFLPQSRLIGGEKINQWSHSLNGIRFTIEPETIKETDDGYSFRVSKIILEADAISDEHIYDFANKILNNFSGILVLRKLSVTRNESVNESNALALRQHKRPNFVLSNIIFEWFSMGSKKHEE